MLQGFERHLGDALPLQSALFLLKPDVECVSPCEEAALLHQSQVSILEN